MNTIYTSEPEPERQQELPLHEVSPLRKFTHFTGAVVSVALVFGLGFWGYKIAVRDVTAVPVVRALAGAMREAPDDPGGQRAEHQGLAVNSVQSDGTVAAAADEVLLAPNPVALAVEDIAQSEVYTGADDQRAAQQSDDTTVAPTHLVDVIADAIQSDQQSLDLGNTGSAAVVKDGLAALPGVRRSPRPKARRVAALIGDVSATNKGTDIIDVDPSSIASGTRMVQLGAFDTRKDAQREWAHIAQRHSDLMGAHKRLIQKAESGGRSFYRLRMVGFNDLGDSRRLCSALLARGTPCIPVTAR